MAKTPKPAESIAVRVVIEGRVQGVGFRWWIEQWANSRGLDGWVRNRREGTVEALFHGPADVVRHMVDACREGPESARVRNLREFEDEPPDDPGFELKKTV